MLKTIIIVIIMFEILIIGHEFGHFITAKKVGINVNEFSIGMGPAIIKKNRGETLYSLRLFPIGGYVSMAGLDDDSEDEKSFNKKSIPQKLLVVSAGSIMNYLMAVLILIIMVLMIGMPSNTIKDVTPGSPAELAGITAGDTIISIDGVETPSWSEVIGEIRNKTEGDIISVELIRDDSSMPIVKEIPLAKGEEGRLYIGILTKYERNLFVAIKQGFIASVDLIKVMFESLQMLINGEASIKEVVGPVGIVNVMGKASSMGVIYVLYLSALISVNLAIVNLLPIPALDGGRLLFLIITAIIGKEINPELEGRIHYFGFVLLIALMIFITIKDINQFVL